MAGGQLRNVQGQIGRLVASRQAQGLPDHELLARFVRQHDEASFAALMERHGPMVLGVCLRVLKNAHDAEDACQAAFLVLARRAGSIRTQASVGSWLYGVAYRAAANLRRQVARRRSHVVPVVEMAQPPAAEVSWREVRA